MYRDLINFRHYTLKAEELGARASALMPYGRYQRSSLVFGECFEDPSGSVILEVFGGLNGTGSWKDYFSDLSSLMEGLDGAGIDAGLMFMADDCLDDIFKAYFKLKG